MGRRCVDAKEELDLSRLARFFLPFCKVAAGLALISSAQEFAVADYSVSMMHAFYSIEAVSGSLPDPSFSVLGSHLQYSAYRFCQGTKGSWREVTQTRGDGRCGSDSYWV